MFCDVEKRLEQCVDEGRNCGTLREYQQDTEENQRNHNGGQPVLFVLSHELPELADYL